MAKTKRPLFDLDDIAAQITEIVKDPFTAQQLPIQKLEAGEDGRTFTFQITSSQDAKKDSTDKGKGPKKEIFFFSYDYPTRKLTWLEDKKKETEYPDWASFSPVINGRVCKRPEPLPDVPRGLREVEKRR